MVYCAGAYREASFRWWCACVVHYIRSSPGSKNVTACIRSEERHRVVNEWAWPHDYFRVCGRGHTPSSAYVGVPTRLQSSIYQRWVSAVNQNAKNNKEKTCVSVIVLHPISWRYISHESLQRLISIK